MSEYYVCKTKVYDKNCIKDALEDIGIPKTAITEYEKAHVLTGHRKTVTAEIVIAKGALGTSHDVGFKQDTAGGYNLVIYDGDMYGQFGKKLTAKAERGTGEFLEHYAKHVILKQAKKKLGHKAKTWQKDGRIKIRIAVS